jgi:lipopolysaccharide exporter
MIARVWGICARRRPKAAAFGPVPNFEPKSMSASVRSGAAWSLASAMLLRLTSVLTTAIIAHILSRLDFGVFAIAMTANGIVNAVGELGMGSCLVRADLDLDSLGPTMVTVSVVTNTLQAGAMVVFAGPIAQALGSVRAVDSIRILALGMLLSSFAAVPNCQLVRDFRQNRLFLAQAIAFVPATAVLFLLAASGSGATAFAWSLVAGQLASGCVAIFSVKKIYLPGFTRSAMSVLFRSGLPLGGANIVNYVLLNVDYALLGHLMGAVALGTYVLAFNVASWPASLLGNVINNVSMPAFSRIKSDPDLLRSAIARAVRSISLAVLPISVLTLVLARPIVLTLYGAKWVSAAEALSVLAAYGAVSILCGLFANVLAGLGLSRLLFAVQLVWLAVLVPAMVIGVHKAGLIGAAVAHIAVIVPIVLPSYLFLLRRTTGVRLFVLARAVLPTLLAACAAALAAFGAASRLTSPLAQLAAGLAAGGLIYTVLTAPQAVELLIPGQRTNPLIRQILRVYRTAAFLAGIPGANKARHGRGARPAQLPRTPKRAAPRRPAPATAAPSADVIRSTARALELLASLGRPEPLVPPSQGRLAMLSCRWRRNTSRVDLAG